MTGRPGLAFRAQPPAEGGGHGDDGGLASASGLRGTAAWVTAARRGAANPRAAGPSQEHPEAAQPGLLALGPRTPRTPAADGWLAWDAVPEGEEGPPSCGASAEIDVQLRADSPESARWRVLLVLRWRAADPLSVDLEVSADPPHPTLPCGHWVILRDLLGRGLDGPVGDAGVRFTPEPDSDRLHLQLRAAGEPDVRLSVPARAVRGFLDQTLSVVPGGNELPGPLLDDLVDRLRRS